jgi:hypothetical protein
MAVFQTAMYGAAVRCKRLSSICRLGGLASMYPASDWSVLCSGPSWKSYVLIKLQTSSGPLRVSRFRMRREDRASISSDSLADLGCYVVIAVPLFVPIRLRIPMMSAGHSDDVGRAFRLMSATFSD